MHRQRTLPQHVKSNNNNSRMSIKLHTIECPICNSQNSYLLTTCTSCGAFIQDRVPKLDLFDCIYRIFENPKQVFLSVARSEQKNYVYTLFAFGGYAVTAIIYMIGCVGNLDTNFIFTIAIFIVVGLPVGLLFFSLLAGIAWFSNTFIWRVRIPYRTSTAFLAYSLIPVVITVFFILPVELAIFGKFLFSDNPPPQSYKPTIFYTLAAIDAIAVAWSIFLFMISFNSVYSIRMIKSLITTIVVIIFCCSGLYLSGYLLHSMLFAIGK